MKINIAACAIIVKGEKACLSFSQGWVLAAEWQELTGTCPGLVLVHRHSICNSPTSGQEQVKSVKLVPFPTHSQTPNVHSALLSGNNILPLFSL